MERAATVVRQTKETNIELTLGLDGGEVVVDTGVGFFDHMLTALAVHGGFGLRLKAEGDWNVDCHHTVKIPASCSAVRLSRRSATAAASCATAMHDPYG